MGWYAPTEVGFSSHERKYSVCLAMYYILRVRCCRERGQLRSLKSWISSLSCDHVYSRFTSASFPRFFPCIEPRCSPPRIIEDPHIILTGSARNAGFRPETPQIASSPNLLHTTSTAASLCNEQLRYISHTIVQRGAVLGLPKHVCDGTKVAHPNPCRNAFPGHWERRRSPLAPT